MNLAVVVGFLSCILLVVAQHIRNNHAEHLLLPYAKFLTALGFGEYPQDNFVPPQQNRKYVNNIAPGNGLARQSVSGSFDNQVNLPRPAVGGFPLRQPLERSMTDEFVAAINAVSGQDITNHRYFVPGGTLYISRGRSAPVIRGPPVISEEQFKLIERVKGLPKTCIQIEFCKVTGECLVQTHNCPAGVVPGGGLPGGGPPGGGLPGGGPPGGGNPGGGPPGGGLPDGNATPPPTWPTPPPTWPTPPPTWPTPAPTWPTPPPTWPSPPPTPPPTWPTPPPTWPTPPPTLPTPPPTWPTPPPTWPTPPPTWPTPPPTPSESPPGPIPSGEPGKDIFCITGGMIKNVLCAGQCQLKQQGTGYCYNNYCICLPIPVHNE